MEQTKKWTFALLLIIIYCTFSLIVISILPTIFCNFITWLGKCEECSIKVENTTYFALDLSNFVESLDV